MSPPLGEGDLEEVSIGTLSFTGINQTKRLGITPPADDEIIKDIHCYATGVVTAVGGLADNNGSLDMIHHATLEAEELENHIDAVRIYALYLLGYDIDAYTPTAVVTAGVDGGACSFNLHIPVCIKSSDGSVTLEMRSCAAHTEYHDSATAFTLDVEVRVTKIKKEHARNTKQILYREDPFDALALTTAMEDHAPVLKGEEYEHAGMMIFTQSAGGTLADLFNTLRYYLGGKPVIKDGTPWATLQDEHAYNWHRGAIVAGVMIKKWKPVHNKSADRYRFLNGGAAIVSRSGIVHFYKGP